MRRFNQMQFKEKLCWERGYMIELCDYQKTDAQKASIATQYLKNTLDKLIKSGIILKYEGLTNQNAQKVSIYPPILSLSVNQS